MRSFALPLAAALLATGALADSNCTDSLYIVVARGTGEKQGTGAFGTIAKNISEQIPDSIIEALEYPATFSDPSYTQSEKEGVVEMQEILQDYHKACPNAKLAVLGYSQGGQVSTDSFCGGSGGAFSHAQALSADFVKNYFAAIILFGDPSHIANATYNKGTSKNDGVFPRSNVTYCEKNYGSLMRSYCDTGDVYCDEGNVSSVHGSYFATYGKEVVDFVVQRYESLNSSSSTTPSSTSAATTAATTPSATAATTSSGAASTTTAASGNSAAGLAPGLALVAIAPVVLAALELMF